MPTVAQTDHVTVTVRKQLLDPHASLLFLMGAICRLLVASTVIWGGFAILAPWLGVTWYAVLIVLIMLNHLNWAKTDSGITAANMAYEAHKPTLARKAARAATKNDNRLFAERANS